MDNVIVAIGFFAQMLDVGLEGSDYLTWGSYFLTSATMIKFLPLEFLGVSQITVCKYLH